MLFCRLLIFFKINFRIYEKYFRNTIQVSNSLDPDQARHFVKPDPDPNITICICYQPRMSVRVCGSKRRKKEDYRVL